MPPNNKSNNYEKQNIRRDCKCLRRESNLHLPCGDGILSPMRPPVPPRRRIVVIGWLVGFEPTTCGSTIRRSDRLSYSHHVCILIGIRTQTSLSLACGTTLRRPHQLLPSHNSDIARNLPSYCRAYGAGLPISRQFECVARLPLFV